MLKQDLCYQYSLSSYDTKWEFYNYCYRFYDPDGLIDNVFSSDSSFQSTPYFPKYTNDHKIGHFSKGHKNNNSTLTWPKRNTTGHETSPDMGTDKKSVSTKNVNSARKTTSSYDKVRCAEDQ